MKLVAAVALPLLAAGCATGSPRTCASLVGLELDAAEITLATEVPAGRFTPPETGMPGVEMELPAYCRVQGVARPTGDSEINFEVWLPAGGEWNGKFQQAGNGGYAGSVPVASLANGLKRGYAVAGTDNGHTGMNADFAPGHPEKVVDFGHRAVHLTAVHAKAVVDGFYGKAPERSYFVGCSDGGREALMEAQRYPEDFDGIVVGAPANNWTRLLTWGVWTWTALNETPASAIPASKLGLIQAAVLSQCDALDQVPDGLIEDPRRCSFDPSRLRCAGADGPDCLTAPQLTALTRIYQGPKSPTTGAPIHPGAVPGTEAVPGNWDLWTVASPNAPLPFLAWFGTTFYQQMVFERPDWDYRTMDFDRDLATALAKLSSVLDATDPNLATFRDRGGKLIQYHGWGDAAIPATGSIDYYEQVLATLGPSVPDFYRLFMVPGMGHCGGGIGPSDFGQAEPQAAQPDPERDIVAALERWVEQGVAPERIIGAGQRLVDPFVDPKNVVRLTRPLCAYPAVATYQGSGSPDDAASYACRTPGG